MDYLAFFFFLNAVRGEVISPIRSRVSSGDAHDTESEGMNPTAGALENPIEFSLDIFVQFSSVISSHLVSGWKGKKKKSGSVLMVMLFRILASPCSSSSDDSDNQYVYFVKSCLRARGVWTQRSESCLGVS